MALFKCKMCGGTLEIEQNASVATCEYCGMQQTLPKLDDERRINLYDRANHFRRNNDFDKAMSIYEQILNEDGSDAEAYWSLVLCRYGIEYVEDPATKKRMPTVNRAQFTSVFDDDNYKSALHYADNCQRALYEEEAKTINEIQKEILVISQKEEPFDVFICYKETDAQGRRTHDSVLANELYHQLTQEGFKVFFSRITLEDKLGTAYEPYIFAALNSARVMVVVGTKPEFFQAVWVRNEWSRYLNLIRQGQKKLLIPAYKDMDPYDLPDEFSHLQAQDMSKLGFMQDLIRGIKKILEADAPKATVIQETVVTEGAASAAPILKRAFLFLEDGDWTSAGEYCEKALDLDPESAEAYVAKLMLDLGLHSRDELGTYAQSYEDNANYRKAIRFGDAALRTELNGYLESIKAHNEQVRLDSIYAQATTKMGKAQSHRSFLEAAEQFDSVADYKDSAALAEQCREKAEEARKDAILNAGFAEIGKHVLRVGDYERAINEFKKIPGWKNADEQVLICEQKIRELNEQAEAERLKRERLEEEMRLEAERIAKRNKKIALISGAAVVACIALVILWSSLIAPAVKYNRAEKLAAAGDYDGAVTVFAELGSYKDSVEKIRETKYAKAASMLANKQYTEAIAAFEELGDYKDAATQAQEATYLQAGVLCETGDYGTAVNMYTELGAYKDSAQLHDAALFKHATQLMENGYPEKAKNVVGPLAKQEAYAEEVDALYNALVDEYYEKGNYKEAVSVYRLTKDFSENSEKYKDMSYKQAKSLFDEKRYQDAKSVFSRIAGYNDADTMVLECSYQDAIQNLPAGNIRSAISLLEQLGDYKDSRSQLVEAKYQYVLTYQDNQNITTFEYLKELKAAKYKQSADIYKKLYAWKVEVVAVNTDTDDDTTNKTSISVFDPVFFHIKLTGGEPDAQLTIKVKSTRPNGSTNWYTFDSKWSDGWSGWYGWDSGIYTNPALGTRGTLRVEFYDGNGNKIGEGTVKMTA